MKNKTNAKPRQATKAKVPNPSAELEAAQIRVWRWDNLVGSITYLQRALRAKFGKNIDTEGGAGTIYLSHDRAELSDRGGSVVGEDAEAIAAKLF